MPALSVCVPVYREHPEPNLATLARSMPASLDGRSGELVVALNGITAERVHAPPDARIIDLGINRGVAPAWNAAAAAAVGDTLVFANDDVVPGLAALAMLDDVLRSRPEAGVIGPVGTRWDLARARHRDFVELDGRPSGDVVACDVVSGFLMAIRRDAFEAVGGFDEFYAPCSFEEVDLCTAVRVRLGLQCYAVAGVEYQHEYGISITRPWKRVRHNGRSEALRSIHIRNRRHFLQKWASAV